MTQLYKGRDVHKTISVVVLCAYLVISCGANLFHTEENPLTTGKTAPASDTCPACKFLAGANSMEVAYETCPVSIESQPVSAPMPTIFVVVSKQPVGSAIILRGPPVLVLS